MAKTRLLLAESDYDIHAECMEYFQLYDFDIQGTATLKAMHEELSAAHYDVLILDLGLPDGNALSALESIRQQFGLDLGIVVTAVRGELDDRIEGLQSGADSYLVKPVNPREIRAVIKLLLQRVWASTENSCVATSWRLIPAARQLFLPDGACIALTGAQSHLLRCLIQARGQIVSRQGISKSFGKCHQQADGRWLDSMVSRLRQKVADASDLALPISTFRNMGYAFSAPCQIEPTT